MISERKETCFTCGAWENEPCPRQPCEYIPHSAKRLDAALAEADIDRGCSNATARVETIRGRAAAPGLPEEPYRYTANADGLMINSKTRVELTDYCGDFVRADVYGSLRSALERANVSVGRSCAEALRISKLYDELEDKLEIATARAEASERALRAWKSAEAYQKKYRHLPDAQEDIAESWQQAVELRVAALDAAKRSGDE